MPYPDSAAVHPSLLFRARADDVGGPDEKRVCTVVHGGLPQREDDDLEREAAVLAVPEANMSVLGAMDARVLVIGKWAEWNVAHVPMPASLTLTDMNPRKGDAVLRRDAQPEDEGGTRGAAGVTRGPRAL